jgi:hypothetical protein
MDDTFMNRLRHWLTPEHPLPILDSPPALRVMCSSFRLYVLGIDGLSRALLEADTRRVAFEHLRDRLFPHLGVRIDANDIDSLAPDGSELRLTERASTRWLAAARRTPGDVAFSFLYSPFAIAVDGACHIGGWVVPASSGSPFPYPRMHASISANRVTLQLLPGPGSSENPAQVLQRARARPST